MALQANRYKNLADLCVKELHSCVDYVQHYSDNREECLFNLLEIAKEHSKIDMNHKKAQQASRATEEYFDNHENDCMENVRDKYNEILDSLTDNETYEDHPIWKSTKRLIEKESAASEASDSGDDIEGEESLSEGILPTQFEPPVDPITKKVIIDPCRNRKCGHIYEYSTVMDHLQNMKNKKKTQCPYIGCPNDKMRANFIFRDKNMKNQIQQYLANRSEKHTDDSVDRSTTNID